MTHPALNDALTTMNGARAPEPGAGGAQPETELDDGDLDEISGGLSGGDASCPSFVTD